MPHGFSDRLRVGFFAQQNNSSPVHVKLKTGADDVNNVGRIVAIDGKRYHEIWGAEEADRIDGIQWIRVMPDPRFGSKIDLQMPELCRKMILTANETVPSSVVPELTLMKFVAPEAADLDSTKHWDNRMYCPEDKACTPQGILAMEPCIAKRGVTVPIYVSFPYFMDADPRISARVEGLPKPNKEKHGIHILVEPNTGIVLEAYVRFQLNLFMANKNDKRYKNMAGPYYFPIAWVEGNIISPKNLVQLLKSVAIDTRTKVPFILSVLAILCGIASFALLIILAIRVGIHRFRNNAQTTGLGDPGKSTFPHAQQSDPKLGRTPPVET
ncbi:Sensory neuron membrane protein 1 [Clonorchis sinensis]|uniref:Sensory neuron membrane protein 1 n=1 Tax=Clonorchis sinensis TaxID=79923 RepID=A0A8T1N2M7_CLOSI|nr:Sensory neuron membrane protein 1 [Clonorchis sinensis]